MDIHVLVKTYLIYLLKINNNKLKLIIDNVILF